MMMLGSPWQMAASRRSISASLSSLASCARPPSSMTTAGTPPTLFRWAAVPQIASRAPELRRIQAHSSAELDG